MCIERRFVPLGNTFLDDQQEQALIAAFEANRYAPKQDSPVQTQQASPATSPRITTGIAVGSARRRAHSAPSSTSKIHEEEAHVESRSLSLPVLNSGSYHELEAAVRQPAQQAETMPAIAVRSAVSQILSTAPLPQVPSWTASAPPPAPEQASNFICEHPALHQQDSSQMMNLSTGVCTNVAEWGGWTGPMEPTLSGFMPGAAMMTPQAAPIITPPPVHHSAHSPLHSPIAPPVHIPSLPCHQPQSPTSEIGLSPSGGRSNRRRGSNKRAGGTSQQHSPLMLSEMLQDPTSRDAPPALELNHNEDATITATIIETLAAGKSLAPALPRKAGEPWLGGAADAVPAAHGTSCKFEEKLSPAREMLRQRGQSLLMQCLRA